MWSNRVLTDALIRFLMRETKSYHRRIPNSLHNLKKHIQPGDVVLLEGRTRISQAIKYLTQSSWSHSGIYVGDRLVRPGAPDRERYRRLFGAEASHLLVEADLVEGVRVVPVARCADYNIRLCRPYCIASEDLERVLEHVIARIGDRYDRRHIFDLGRYLAPIHLVPARFRRKAFFFGDRDSHAVICSSLIAAAFLEVRYPILPILPTSVREQRGGEASAGRNRVRTVHPRLVLPRDFDLSPYFRIVKFNSVEEGPFDYRALDWEEPVTAGPVEARPAW